MLVLGKHAEIGSLQAISDTACKSSLHVRPAQFMFSKMDTCTDVDLKLAQVD